MKKIVSVLMTGALLMSSSVASADIAPRPVPHFTDVTVNDPSYNDLGALQEDGVISGYPDGTFRPNNPVNRAEFSKIIATSLYPESKDCASSSPGFGFSDIQKSAWYENAICVLFSKNIIAGYPVAVPAPKPGLGIVFAEPGQPMFKPNEKINFAEAAKIIVMAYSDNPLVKVNPAPSGVEWYKPYVDKLNKLEVTPASIKSNNQFITRGEMVMMIRAMYYVGI